MVDNSQKRIFGKILQAVSEELDITPTQYEDARGKYQLVGEWLAESGTRLHQFNPAIYPQGSIKLGTAVRPLQSDEFDVDLVCEMNIPPSVNQGTVMDMVKRRLDENVLYHDIMIPKKRCLQLNFKGSFHMDVLPAIPDESKGNCCILVPDRDLKTWMPSNPKGYAQWFEDRMKVILESMIRAAADIEDLPDNFLTRTPLQRAVQLIKRQRDIAFVDDKDHAPISIVITTLAAKAYNNESDLFDALWNIIEGMPHMVDSLDNYPAVLNPTNPEENFAEKWIKDPSLHRTFLKWLRNLQRDLQEALNKRGNVLHESLRLLFGDTVTKRALMRYGDDIDRERRSGLLKMAPASGILGSKGVRIQNNTFYGR